MSMLFDHVVRQGTAVVGDVVVESDIGILGERIAAVAEPGTLSGRTMIEAAGKYVLPGGIDTHVHIHWPFLDSTTCDDFFVATRAAALGGTSTIVDWAVQRTGTPIEAYHARRQEADGNVGGDYHLHSTLTELSPRTLDGIVAVKDAGVRVLKLYMTYRKRGILASDAMLWEVMRRAADLGMVVSVHAENASIHEWNQEQLEAQGRTRAIDFAAHKSGIVEGEAINRAIYIAGEAGATLLIRHISSARGIQLVREAKRRGQAVFAETCAHYLVLTDEVYSRQEGALFICSPPIRSREDQAALWDAVADGTIEFIGSDHAAFSRAQKLGPTSAFSVPNGLPGVQTRLPLVFSEGFMRGRISLPQFVSLTAASAARFYGLYPRKGALLPGSDADLLIVDPSIERTISAAALEMGVDWTPYEGLTLRGAPTSLLVRGRLAVADGAFVGVRGFGRFLPSSNATAPAPPVPQES